MTMVLLGALLVLAVMAVFTVNITATGGVLALVIVLACFWLPVAFGVGKICRAATRHSR